MNRLAKEQSPYLLQHAQNPVEWYSWGQEAFDVAARDNKPVLLSIGYSTCHWCHVMAHESFENPSIAEIMNTHFVCIKVDREERPDIDQVYMTAVTALTGQGGWPLTVFLTPDKKPFYGGTYFPPEPRWGSPGFSQVLLSIAEAWQKRKGEVLESGESLANALKEAANIGAAASLFLNINTLHQAFGQVEQSFDHKHGGTGNAPKFPTGHLWSFLLRYARRFDHPLALQMTEQTLSAMSKGGIYDHLGGGFHRYSTDQMWHVPHFEKMLYDQAILTRTFLEAFQYTGDNSYASLARDVLDYVLRDLTDRQGGFYSAEDADSIVKESGGHQKKEGAFYVWESGEIEGILGVRNASIFNYVYGVQPAGNALNDPHGEFIDKNILFKAHDENETAAHFNLSLEEINTILQESKRKLFNVRLQKPRPHLDDKILTDWNGLMISAFAFAGKVLGEKRYEQAAVQAMKFIQTTLVRADGRLMHSWRGSASPILGNLDDYAFHIQALLDLYEVSFDVHYLEQAIVFADRMLDLFADPAGGFYFTGKDAEELLLRQKIIYDGAYPSGNSIAALDLLRLSVFTERNEFREQAEGVFRFFGGMVGQYPSGYAQTLIALDFMLGPRREIVLVGSKKAGFLQQVYRRLATSFFPNQILIWKTSENSGVLQQYAQFIKPLGLVNEQPTVYICTNHACQLPLCTLADFEKSHSGL